MRQSDPDGFVIAQEIAGCVDQIVEVEQRGFALIIAEALEEGTDLLHQRGEQMGAGADDERAPGFLASCVVVLSLRAEALGLCA